MIILTKEQADEVRGISVPGHALDPIELKDGTFVLPETVLSDPAHSKHLVTLTVGQKRVVHDDEWKTALSRIKTEPPAPVEPAPIEPLE